MIIDFHKRFIKHYEKLSPKLKQKTDEVIEQFKNNPFDSKIHNHALTGDMQERRAFSVTGNYRVTFEEYKNYTIVILLDVGTHNQVYGQ